MKRKPQPAAVDLEAFAKLGPYARNRQLIEWLSDDERRLELRDAVDCIGGVLEFPSLARDDVPPQLPRVPPDLQWRSAFLLTDGAHVRLALRDTAAFGNSPYGDLGNGSFMLALDPQGPPGERAALQRDAARAAFRVSPQGLRELADHAFAAVLPTALGRSEFDLALLAEEAALRFASVLFGYGSADFPLLLRVARAGYRALNHQILGRHFDPDPRVLPAADGAMAELLARTAQLIGEYQLNQLPDRPADLESEGSGVFDLQPVLRSLAFDPGPLTGEERAVLAVGSLVGTVGNVQASVCIALRDILSGGARGGDPAAIEDAFDHARRDATGHALWPSIADALQRQPPVAFLPRRALRDVVLAPHGGGGKTSIPGGAECILLMAGATRRAGTDGGDGGGHHAADGLIFGHGLHACLGQALSVPLLQRLCAGVLRLPSLAETLDPDDGLPIGLQKQWGFGCLSYPLRHRRDLRVVQQSLNVVMRVKSPVAAHAEALRGVIRFGAPRIEAALRDSGHVHFAWFEFVADDTQLVLHTVFDGDFGPYLQHFALAVGDVFDRLFEHIEGGPPAPVKSFPNEFVAVIRQFHRPPAAGYFFSAYPRSETAQIRRSAEALR